jgi:hypothetical protein
MAERKLYSEEDMLAREKVAVDASRRERLGQKFANAPWWGLGLSGGGIRSAALALGVLQALAEKNVLKRFDYISSVSGGGYLAGSLQWWWYSGARDDAAHDGQPQFGTGQKNFPYGPARFSSGKESVLVVRTRRNLSFLRAYSSYLTPGNGLSSWSLLAVTARTVITSFFVWIFLIAALFALLHHLDYMLLEPNTANSLSGLWSPLDRWIPGRWKEGCIGQECELRYKAVYAWLLWALCGVIAGFFVASLVFAFLSRAPQSDGRMRSLVSLLFFGAALAAYFVVDVNKLFASPETTTLVAVIVAAFFSLVAVFAAVSEWATRTSLNASYLLRRNFEVILGKTFIPALVLFAVANVPLLPYFVLKATLGPKQSAFAMILGLLSGVGSALYGYYTFIRSIVPGIAAQIAATVGAATYVYATFVIGYFLSIVWAKQSEFAPGIDSGLVGVALEVSFAIALTLSLFANINYVGLHRFYRDRLMEVFMPTDLSVADMKTNFSPVADNLLISELCPRPGEVAPVPYPLINTNAILINDSDAKVVARGGDNFVISPLFVGSGATGWRDSADYIQDNGPLTLATSIAASGAAASASAGYIGTGITMNPLVAAVMSLLNIRLGIWIPNPKFKNRFFIKRIPTFLYPGLVSGLLSKRHSRTSGFIELTDGGHFENLGLYELVRRKLSTILIVDGEADPSVSLSSLVSATRRIEQDFGATLCFPPGKGPERLMMYPEKGYPSGLKYAQAPFVVGTITYNDGATGTLVYVKSTLIKEMDFVTAGYLASNPAFPHQPTVDQFFDADQFDAYRFLGYDVGSVVIKLLNLDAAAADSKSIMEAYAKLPA